jgi:hypothetical protein
MYGYTDEAKFRREASVYDIRAYERMHEPVMPPNRTIREFPVYGRGLTYLLLGVTFCLIILFMSGCAGGLQQADDAFELAMVEYARKWEGGISHWAIEDIHIDTNRVVNDRHYNPKRPELNGYCWETAEIKHDLAVEKGFDPADMEIIVFVLNDDTAIWGNVDFGSTHAVLRVGDTIYDNGFLSTIPFDVEYLTWYGTIIPNIWSEEKYL